MREEERLSDPINISASRRCESSNNAWSAIDSMADVMRASMDLPGLSIKIFEATTHDFHELLVEPRDYLQIGYLFDSVAEERNIRFPDFHGVARYQPLGSLYVVPPDTAFGTRCSPIRGAGLLCHLDVSRYGTFVDQDLWRRVEVLEAATNIRSPEMKRAMGDIVRELSHASRGRELAIECLVSLVMVHLGRYMGEYPCSKGILPAWRVKRVEEMVREHVGQPLSISEIAQSCGISNSHLMRAYKRTTGRTIGQLIEDVRIERAKSLLREGECSVTAIAEKLNYSSRPHFASAFRRAEGVSPLSYRQIFAKPVRCAAAVRHN